MFQLVWFVVFTFKQTAILANLMKFFMRHTCKIRKINNFRIMKLLLSIDSLVLRRWYEKIENFYHNRFPMRKMNVEVTLSKSICVKV